MHRDHASAASVLPVARVVPEHVEALLAVRVDLALSVSEKRYKKVSLGCVEGRLTIVKSSRSSVLYTQVKSSSESSVSVTGVARKLTNCAL